MRLEVLKDRLTVCKLPLDAQWSLALPLYFLSRTDEELSLVCRTEDVPADTLEREDGWRGFRVAGVLDFSLTGILSRLSGVLAEEGIGIFAVSTYNTDYILVKEEKLPHALDALRAAGHEVAEI